MKDKLLTFEHKKARDFFLAKISFLTGPLELNDMIEENIEDINIIDVRKYDDYIDGHIPFAEHIPFETFEEYLDMLDKDKVNIFYTYHSFCKRAAKACYMAADEGYPVMLLEGGFKVWDKLGYEVIKTSGNVDM